MNRSETFSVPAVIYFDEAAGARVSEVVEHRASWIVSSVRREACEREQLGAVKFGMPSVEKTTAEHEIARVKYLLGDLSKIYHRSERDRALIDLHSAEFEEAANKAITAPRNFSHTASAGAVLARLGDATQLKKMVELYFDGGRNSSDLNTLCLCFDEKQTAAEPKMIEALKEQILGDACSDQYRYVFLEQLTGIDDEFRAPLLLELAQNSEVLSVREKAVASLVKRHFSEEVFELAIEYLSDKEVQEAYYNCIGVLRATLERVRLQQAGTDVKNRFVALTRTLSKLHVECLDEVARHGGEAFAPLMWEVIENPNDGDHLRIALLAVRNQLAELKFQSLLRKQLKNSKFAESIFDLCCESLGVEASTEILKRRWEIEKAHWIFMLIAQNTPPDLGEGVVPFIDEAFDVSLKDNPDSYAFENQRRRFEVVGVARKFNQTELAQRLEKRIPNIEEYWFEHSSQAHDYVLWFNRHFDLEQPLSVRDVFRVDGSVGQELRELPGVFRVKNFKVATFQAAGFGRIVDPECWGVDGGLFADLCKLSGDTFRVECHDVVAGQRVRLLINEMVYEFAVNDDWSWYDSAPASDVLNVLLERRRFEERFFVFKQEYGNSYVRFVLFAKPSKVKAFASSHGEFDVESGCETLWQ